MATSPIRMRHKKHHDLLSPAALETLAGEALERLPGGPTAHRMARAAFFGEPLGVHVMAAAPVGTGRTFFRVCLFVYDTGRVLYSQFASFDVSNNAEHASKTMRKALASQISRAKRSDLFPAYQSAKQARSIGAFIGRAGLEADDASGERGERRL